MPGSALGTGTFRAEWQGDKREAVTIQVFSSSAPTSRRESREQAGRGTRDTWEVWVALHSHSDPLSRGGRKGGGLTKSAKDMALGTVQQRASLVRLA